MTQAEIKPHDLVLVLSGEHKGKVGTAMRVTTTTHAGRTQQIVLVTFPAGEADYINLHELEKVEDRERRE